MNLSEVSDDNVIETELRDKSASQKISQEN